jgi:hypothetical protein
MPLTGLRLFKWCVSVLAVIDLALVVIEIGGESLSHCECYLNLHPSLSAVLSYHPDHCRIDRGFRLYYLRYSCRRAFRPFTTYHFIRNVSPGHDS